MGKGQFLSYSTLLSVFCTSIFLPIDVVGAKLVWKRQVSNTNDDTSGNFNINSNMVMYAFLFTVFETFDMLKWSKR
jgi:hypothetical protein